MAVARRIVTVKLDEDLVGRARRRAGGSAKPDAEIVEEALAVYLGMKALDEAQAESGLCEDEADRVASEQLDAVRRERDAAG
jgi:predicted transcriptional regulator